MPKPLQSILIKPVGSFCNIRCDYCFYLEKHRLYTGPPSTHQMTEATLEKLISEMFIYSDFPTFLWQGGEPTVMGLEFFEKAVALQKFYAKSKGKSYANALQTNAMLLTEAWAEFLRRENFLVGVSLDGPEHIHDRYRKDSQGQGTFQRVLTKAQMLLAQRVPVNILATVNDYSVNYPKEIYKFLKDQGFQFMQFSPVVEADPQHPEIAAPYSVKAHDYGRFLEQLFNCWVKDFDFKRLKQKTSIRFFDTLIQVYLGMMPDHCALHKECNDYLVVEHNGDLFSCDFLVDTDTRLGNLHELSLHTAFQSASHLAFGKRKANLDEECQHCPWLRQCYGGCIKDRIRDSQDKGRNRFCESYKFFFSRADARFQELAKLYRQYYQ